MTTKGTLRNNTVTDKSKTVGFIKSVIVRREFLTFGILLLIWIVLSLINQSYATLLNFSTTLQTLSFFGIVSVGLSLVIMQGDTDLSVGASAGLSSLFASILMVETNSMGMGGTNLAWLGFLICLIITMSVGMLIGMFNAIMVVRLNLPTFIATVGMKYLLDGFKLVLSGGYYVYPLPKQLLAAGQFKIIIGELTIGSSVILLFVLLVIVHIVLNHTKFGRNILSTGSNKLAAQLAGIKTNQVRFQNYMILHALCSLAGVLNAGYISQAATSIGTNWELIAISGCAIGGIKMTGGAGNMTGLIIGLFTLFSVSSAIAYIGINTFLQDVLVGVVLLAIVVFEKQSEKRKVKA